MEQTLHNILKSNVTENVTIPYNLQQNFKAITHPSSHAIRGRAIAHALNWTSSYYYSPHNGGIHEILSKIYALYCNKSRGIELTGLYQTYGASDMVENSDYNILTGVTDTNTTAVIKIMHIGKGKTYFDQKITADPPAGIHQKAFELALVQQANHYVRVYTTNLGPSVSVAIFTNFIDQDFVDKVYNLIPHFLGLDKKFSEMEIDPTTHNTQEYKRLKAIIDLAKYFYADYTGFATEHHVSKINAMLETIAELYPIDNTKYFDQFANNFARIRSSVIINQTRREQQSAQNDIQTYEKQLEKAYERLQEAIAKEHHAQTMAPDNIKEFLNSIKGNKYVNLLSSNANYLEMLIVAPLKYYNTADLQVLIDNKNSVFYSHLNNDSQKILKAAILDNKFQVLVYAHIKCCIQHSAVEPLEFIARNEAPFNDAVPNPHLTYYNCWTAARSQLKQYVLKGDYELILPQLIAAVQSINMAEGATFYSRFLPDFNRRSMYDKILYNPETGETFSKADALKLLEEAPKPETQPTNTSKEYTQIEVEDDDSMWED